MYVSCLLLNVIRFVAFSVSGSLGPLVSWSFSLSLALLFFFLLSSPLYAFILVSHFPLSHAYTSFAFFSEHGIVVNVFSGKSYLTFSFSTLK